MIRLAVFQDEAAGRWPERLARLDAALAAEQAGSLDLVVAPELFTTGYGPREAVLAFDAAADAAAEGELAERCRRHRIAIAYGTPEPVAGQRYNTARLLDRDGRRLTAHRKRALPPQDVEAVFTPGERVDVVAWEGRVLALLVCFDVEFPENVRAAARAGAELVLVPTALWDRCPIVARRVVPVRAFENGVFVAYANYAGPHAGTTYLGESVVAGPDGTELARAGAAPGLVRADIDTAAIAAARARLPFLAMSAAL